MSGLVLAGLALSAPVAHAQQPAQPAQPAAKPAGQQAQNSWIKLCQDKESVNAGVVSSKKVCLTHHERLSSVNGMVLVSAAVRNIEGEKNERLMVLVPLGVALPPGIQLVIDKEKPLAMKFTFCHVGGCTAEAIAPKEVIDKFKKGNELKVLALNNRGKTVVFPIPLSGFTKAYTGPPIDTAKYQAARKEIMQLIQKRQLELAKKAKDGAQQPGAAQQPAAPKPAQ